MDEAWQRDLRRPRTPADGAAAFEYGNTPTVLGELYRRCEPVGARADDDGIVCPYRVHTLIVDCDARVRG